MRQATASVTRKAILSSSIKDNKGKAIGCMRTDIKCHALPAVLAAVPGRATVVPVG
jgi:hypothetical protein